MYPNIQTGSKPNENKFEGSEAVSIRKNFMLQSLIFVVVKYRRYIKGTVQQDFFTPVFSLNDILVPVDTPKSNFEFLPRFIRIQNV